MDENITDLEIAREMREIKRRRFWVRVVRVLIGVPFGVGAYLLYDASPNVTDTPLAKLTLKDVGTGLMFFVGVWMLIGIAWACFFNEWGEQAPDLKAEAEGNLKNRKGLVSLDDN